ncbi:hypothetical protein CSV86_022555 [Pseudomonas putida CSV86]|uniref:Uncharacterized protein n=1 Tax=Pseudomonas bharatica CSV86 TaxID=1005395 RepID=L1M189_9PSED|nr:MULTISPECIES: hypothetical protein [Pseudomonas]MDG9881275.1 hypothetical protein [Pseudomonas sp. GD04058]NNJ17762.1 hypothetical protein [Pseudomonas bharatica CSV86]
MDVDGYTMWITGGSLVLVAPQVSELECNHALGSLRHAQLLADGVMASRFDQYRRWYRAYRNAFGRRGWRVTHSCQSVETAGGRTLLSPTQPLLLWLGSQHGELGELLELGIDSLLLNPPGLAQLSCSALQARGGITRMVLELGVLRPGSQLSLCSIALETSATLDQQWLKAPLAGATLRGDLYFQSLLAEPAPEMRDSERDGYARLSAGHTLH